MLLQAFTSSVMNNCQVAYPLIHGLVVVRPFCYKAGAN